MADQQLNIKLNAIDNASKAFSDIKNSIFSLKGALIGLGAGAVLKSIYDIGVIANDVRERLDETAKAGYGGAEAFNQLTKFAIDAKIPLIDVLKASNDLLRVSKSPQELAKNLEIVSNISAKYGMEFGMTADQLAKAYTKGIDSAREFTTIGIRNLDEFSTFADTSLNRLPDLFDKVFGSAGVFGKANENIKRGLSGTIISLGNSLDQFKIKTSQNFFGELEKELGSLDIFIKKNQVTINEYADKFGKVLAESILALGKAIKIVFDNLDLFIVAIKALIGLKVAELFYDIAKSVEAFAVASTLVTNGGLIGFLIKLTGLLVGAATAFAYLGDKTSKNVSIYDEFGNVIYSFDEGIKASTQSIKEQGIEIDKWYNAYQTASSKIEALDIGKVFRNIKESNDASIKDLQKLTSDTLVLSQVIREGLNTTIKDFSKGIAESIVLGKSLGETLKSAVQGALIRILSSQIELLIRLGTQLIFEKAISAEKLYQAAVGGGNFLGSLGSFFGGGGGGLDAGNPASYGMGAEGGSVTAGVPITVGERGRELFIPKSNGSLIPNSDLGSIGGNNYNFTIVANDVKGVKELLLNNRSTIVNIMNQALNAKGKSSLV
jgi:hypothetical protein